MKIASGQNLGSKKYFDFGLKTVVLPLFSTRDFIGEDMGFAWNVMKEKQVTQAAVTYAYHAYLETLLNYGPSTKDSQLTAALYYKDTGEKMDVADPTVAGGNRDL